MAFGSLGGLGRGFGKAGVLLGGARGPQIQLSKATFSTGSSQGTAIGTLSVSGGTGSYVFTLTDSHSSAVQLAGTNGVNLQVGSAVSSSGSFSISVHADNGAGSTFDKTFLISAILLSLVAGQGSFVLTGDPMTQAYAFGADEGLFSLVGEAVAFTQGTVPILSAAEGSFSLTGNAATLSYASAGTFGAGNFALTGQSIAPAIATPAAKGTFTLTGEAATLTAPSTYTGPGDVAAATQFYGLRAYNAAYATGSNPAVDLVDQAGANPITINILSTGAVDVASISAWVTAHSVTTIKVTKFYEQVAGVSTQHLVQATLAKMPTLVLGITIGSGSFPVVRFDGSSSTMSTSSSVVQNQPFTMSAVYQRTGNVGGVAVLFGGPTVGFAWAGASGRAAGAFAGGSITDVAASENAFHALQGVFDDAGTGSLLNVDGTPTSVTGIGTSGLSNLDAGDDGNGRYFMGDVTEMFLRNGHDSSTVQTNTNSNQHAYYGNF